MPPEDAQEKHVFVSYVRENSEEVDKLCAVLDAVDIPYWRDRSNLGPGDEWKVKIRDAIRSGSMAFLACFSNESRAKEKSYMNEELTLATEEWRLRPPGRTWLIPVRFDDGPVPEWDLGAGKTLTDLNYSDLFGKGYTPNVAQLVEKIKEVMGLTPSLDPAVVRTAVEETATERRPALLRRLTKEMIRDPLRDIELDDLISQEVARVLAAMRDEERFPTSSSGGTNSELAVGAAEMATDYWHLVEPFCWSLQIAARWARNSDALVPWAKGIHAISHEARKPFGGHTYLISLKHVPSLISVFVAAMAAVGQGKWANFKSLLVDNTVTVSGYENTRLPVIQTVDPWGPFDSDLVPQLLANAMEMRKELSDAQAALDANEGKKFHTPTADWMHGMIRPMFDEQYPDGEAYDSAFDSTEVMLGIVAADLFITQSGGEVERPIRLRPSWFGRSAWRSRRRPDPVQAILDNLTAQDESWPPLQAGLFGGSVDRARTATTYYAESFAKYRSSLHG